MERQLYTAKPGFVRRSVAGEALLVPVGEASRDLNGMVMLNETGDFLWSALQTPKTEAELTALLTEEFETDEATALAGVRKFVQTGLLSGLITCETD